MLTLKQISTLIWWSIATRSKARLFMIYKGMGMSDIFSFRKVEEMDRKYAKAMYHTLKNTI